MKIRLERLVFIAIAIVIGSISYAQSPVEIHGDLKIEGTQIVDKNNKPVQLKGMSFFWSQWMPKYYNPDVVKWLAEDWKCTVLRAAMGVDHGGYLENPEKEQARIEKVVDAAIANGIYVIIDYHAHNAHHDTDAAKKFFKAMSKKYAKYPNVIYEIFNEPLKDHSWNDTVKPYAEEIVATIRKNDPDNIIVIGTPVWSQRVDVASQNPLEGKNLAYTLHFYAATHKEELRNYAQEAIDNGICLFVTEFGTCEASGNGKIDYEETLVWMDFMDKHMISWCNWSISSKREAASALETRASMSGNWTEEELTDEGEWIRAQIRGDK